VQQLFDAYYKSNDPTLTQKLWAFPTGAPPSADKLFEEPVYFRGAMTLHVLRTQIGDEAFFRTLKTWVERNKHGYGTTKDFIAISEEISGKNLGDLFQKWLYEAGKPKL
jgi:aminopeptidase N